MPTFIPMEKILCSEKYSPLFSFSKKGLLPVNCFTLGFVFIFNRPLKEIRKGYEIWSQTKSMVTRYQEVEGLDTSKILYEISKNVREGFLETLGILEDSLGFLGITGDSLGYLGIPKDSSGFCRVNIMGTLGFLWDSAASRIIL